MNNAMLANELFEALDREETCVDNRFVRVGVSIELFAEICTRGWQSSKNESIICVDGLPKGAQYRWAWADDRTNALWLVFYHPSFENVPHGAEVPVLNVQFKKLS